MFKYILCSLGMILVLSSCAGRNSHTLQYVTSGKIGCSQEDTTISNKRESGKQKEWDAECKDVKYHCSSTENANGWDTSCTSVQ